MGMFDTVHVPVALLKVQEDTRIQKYASLLKHEVTDFQTKDLYNVLQNYHFKNVDGKYLFHKDEVEGEYVKNENPNEIFGFHFNETARSCNPELITDTVCLYDYYNSDTIDISIELKVKLVNGVLVSMECIEYEETDPTPRIERKNETMKMVEAQAAYYKTFRGKVARASREVLLSVHYKLEKFNNWLQEVAFKL
jgi:hypothetical protein